MNWPLATIGDVAEINPRSREWSSLPPETTVSFVPMASISEVSASITAQEVRCLKEVRKGYVPFREGDVLLAKITPCFENGRIALANQLIGGIGFGSTKYHVIRAGSHAMPKYLYSRPQIWQSLPAELRFLLPNSRLAIPAQIRESVTPELGVDGTTLLTKHSFTNLSELIPLNAPPNYELRLLG